MFITPIYKVIRLNPSISYAIDVILHSPEQDENSHSR